MSVLTNYLPFILLAIGVVVLIIVLYVLLVVIRARRAAAIAEQEQEPLPQEREEAESTETSGAGRSSGYYLRRSFQRGIAALKTHVGGSDFRYRVPWFALLGQNRPNSSRLFANAGLPLPLGLPEEDLESELGCRWWVLDGGLILEPGRDLILRMDGRTSDERGWDRFLRLLQRYRPLRPIDGFIVEVSCNDLYGSANQSPAGLAEIEEEARALYDRLSSAQRTLGLRCPVYVLVTDCEAIKGFEPFWEGVNEERRQGIFGWASPYRVDRAIGEDWLGEAFESIDERLRQEQVRVLASAGGSAKQEEAFSFPSEFLTLQQPLDTFLRQIFRASKYHETVLFRGLYFTGQLGPLVGQTPLGLLRDSSAESGRVSQIFLRDPVNLKILPEANLATPTTSSYLRGNRLVRVLQFAVVGLTIVLGLGLWNAHRRLQNRTEDLEPFLLETSEGAGLFTQNRERLRSGTLRILDELSDLDAVRFGSIFIPTSWGADSFNVDLEASFAQSINLVFEALQRELAYEVGDLLEDSEQLGLGKELPIDEIGIATLAAPVRSLPEFLRLKNVSDRLTELEGTIETYDSILDCRVRRDDDAVHSALEKLGVVVNSLYGKPLQSGFFQKADLYQKGLTWLPCQEFSIEIEERERLYRRLRELAERLNLRLFDDAKNPLTRSLSSLQANLHQLSLGSSLGDGAAERRIVRQINRLDTALSMPGLDWAFRDEFDPGREYRELILALRRSQLARVPSDENIADVTERAAREEWREFRNMLASYRSPLTGSLLTQRDREVQMEVSPGLLQVKAAIEAFLDEGLLLDERMAHLELESDLRQAEDLHWSIHDLRDAESFYDTYTRFENQVIAPFPDRIQDRLARTAQEWLRHSMVERINRAQQPRRRRRVDPEEDLKARIDDFSVVFSTLDGIIHLFGRGMLGFEEEQRRLSQLVHAQAASLLEEVDSLLESQRPFLPRNDQAWTSVGSSLALEAFGVSDATTLKAYVVTQREHVQRLADEFARPLAEALNSLDISSRTLSKWSQIIHELDAYEEMQPGNSVQQLEDWILRRLPEVTLESCFDSVASSDLGESTDFFQARLGDLVEALETGCSQTAGTGAVDSYREVESFFRQRLADRYPFVDAADTHFPQRDADPIAVRDFFSLLEKHRSVIEMSPSSGPAFEGQGEEILGFLEELAKVREFFGTFLGATPDFATPVVDFEVELRLRDGERERCGNQIIEWRFEVEDQAIRRPETGSGRWHFGDEVRLILRWAQDSPWRPAVGDTRAEIRSPWRSLALPSQPLISRDGESLVIRYKDGWSLIRLIDAFRRPGGFDPHPHTLGFVIPTRRRAEAVDEDLIDDPTCVEPGGDAPDTQVYVRVSLLSADSSAPLELPTFPHEAPVVPSWDNESRNGGVDS